MHTTVLDFRCGPAATGFNFRGVASMAVPAVGFAQRLAPRAPTPAQPCGSRQVNRRRSRAAAFLDYFGAAFVLMAVASGPILGWLIFP